MELYGSRVVTAEGVLEHAVVRIEDGVIAAVEPAAARAEEGGTWLLPGLIDTHSDSIEKELEPRPNTNLPIALGFHELERRLVFSGVTTIYHAVSLGTYGSREWARREEVVRRIVDHVKSVPSEHCLIRHRIHLRVEISNPEAAPVAERMLLAGQVDEMSFMDHTPGQGQHRDTTWLKQWMMSNRRISEAEAEATIERRQAAPHMATGAMEHLAELAHARGIPIASHDDDTAAKVAYASERLHVGITEFPIEMGAAEEARRRGLWVVMGAPNALRGGSLSGNLSAGEAIAAGVVDILCSDYYPPALLHTVFQLAGQGHAAHEVVNMVSHNPARALGLDGRLGAIAPGRQADLLAIRVMRGRPHLEAVLVAGRPVARVNYGAPALSRR